MSPRILVLIAAVLASSISMARADTVTRTYFNPAVFGKPVALCMSDRASCGTNHAKLADQSVAQSKDIVKAVSAEKLVEARGTLDKLSATCNACHELHPEQRK